MDAPEEEDLEQRYFRALAALERGNLPVARREFDILVLDAPEFAPAWDGLGRCFDAEGELAKAEECFRRAIRLDRGNWPSRCHWAAALRRAGRVQDACRRLREAARVAPRERRIHYELGRCLTETGELEEAVRVLRAALEHPEREVRDAQIHVALGAAEAERGSVEAAEAAFERACLLAPDDPEVYYQWALLAAESGDAANAERLANRARALDRRSLRSFVLLVRIALRVGEWERADTRIRELEGQPGGRLLALALRAELASRRGEAEAARALALDTLREEAAPNDPAAGIALAVLRQPREPEAGLHGFRLLLEIDCGAEVYYRPYVVLAADEEQARWLVAEMQDELDASPWQVLEGESFDHEGEAAPGVYQVNLRRVMFPRDHAS